MWEYWSGKVESSPRKSCVFAKLAASIATKSAPQLNAVLCLPLSACFTLHALVGWVQVADWILHCSRHAALTRMASRWVRRMVRLL